MMVLYWSCHLSEGHVTKLPSKLLVVGSNLKTEKYTSKSSGIMLVYRRYWLEVVTGLRYTL